MGFSPQQVDAMSMWQYFSVLDGWNKANDPDAGKSLSSAEVDDLWSWMEQKRQGDPLH